MILYKLGDEELIRYEIRSIRRDLAASEKGYKIEHFMLKFLIKQLPDNKRKRGKLFEKYLPDLLGMQQDPFEQQLLRIFDFTAWIEAMLKQQPLATILSERHAPIAETENPG